MRHRTRWIALLYALAIFAANWYTCRRLFSTEYLPHLHSIEAAYIALTRYTMAHWGDLWWFPLWHAGMPFQNTYQPGLHLMSAAVADAAGLTAAGAYHFTIALFYCLGPVFLFVMAWRMSGEATPSFCSALLYSLFSPSTLLMQTVIGDVQTIWYPRRYQALVFYGEGPNVTGLTLVPLALLGVHLVFHRGAPWMWLFAALGLGATVLVSWPAGVVLTLAAIAYLLAHSWRESALRLPALGLLAIAAYLMIAPWIPPSTVRVNQANAQYIGDYPWTAMHIVYWLCVAAGILILRRLLGGTSTFLRFSLMFTCLMGVVPLAADRLKIYLLPQPERFHLAMEIGIALSVTFSAWAAIQRWPRLRWIFAAMLLALVVKQLGTYRYHNRNLTTGYDITQSVEYRVARWADANLGGRRIFAPGSIAFWLNTWTDTPQVTGCCLPGLPNWMNAIASYIITSDDGAGDRGSEVALLWLRAFGASAVVTGGPRSKEHFHDFVHPYKFEGKLKLLWKEGDDMIYEVSRRSHSLAHVVESRHLVQRPPVNGMDIEQLEIFVKALEDETLPAADFRWISTREAQVSAELRAGQVVAVQETFHRGWQATSGGRAVPIEKDGLGLMVLRPSCQGPCTIELRYDGGAEMAVARAGSWLSLGALLAACAWRLRELRRRRSSLTSKC